MKLPQSKLTVQVLFYRVVVADLQASSHTTFSVVMARYFIEFTQ